MSPLFPLLALIARSDAYGYQLKRVVETEFAPYWKMDYAQLYRSLATLRERDWVHVRVMPNDSAPERKFYSVTPAGRHALERWIRQPAVSDNEFQVKIRLAISLGWGTQRMVQAEQARRDAEREQDTERVALSAQRPVGVSSLADAMPLQISGSDDLLLTYLARESGALASVNGSSAGLANLASGEADVVGTHLCEPDANEYNISFVQHLVGEQDILLVRLARREYGLLVASDNPKSIRSARDLQRRHARLVNRTVGSGARLWLQRHVRAARLDPTTLPGWGESVTTYDAVARAIATNTADVGPGLRATAAKFGLGFIPLGEERFDLAIPRALYESRRGEKLREILHSQKFRAYARTLPGYDVSHCGSVIAEIKYGSRRKR